MHRFSAKVNSLIQTTRSRKHVLLVALTIAALSPAMVSAAPVQTRPAVNPPVHKAIHTPARHAASFTQQTFTGQITTVKTGNAISSLEGASTGILLNVKPIPTPPDDSSNADHPGPLPKAWAPSTKSVILHLGSKGWVNKAVDQLPKHKLLTFHVFEGSQLPTNHYLVKSIESEDTVFVFRDDQMKPVWASKKTASKSK